MPSWSREEETTSPTTAFTTLPTCAATTTPAPKPAEIGGGAGPENNQTTHGYTTGGGEQSSFYPSIKITRRDEKHTTTLAQRVADKLLRYRMVYRYIVLHAYQRASSIKKYTIDDEESNSSWDDFLQRRAWQVMEILGQIILFLVAELASTAWILATNCPIPFFVAAVAMYRACSILRRYRHEKRVCKATKMVLDRIAKYNYSGGLAACFLRWDLMEEAVCRKATQGENSTARFMLAHWGEILLKLRADDCITSSWGFVMGRNEEHFVFLHPAAEGNTVAMFGSFLTCEKVLRKMPDGTSIHKSRSTRPCGSALKTSHVQHTERQMCHRVQFVDRGVARSLRTTRTVLTEEWTL